MSDADSDSNLISLFTEALNRTDPAERAMYLDQACGGDADLRARVEALLAAHSDAGQSVGPDPTLPIQAESASLAPPDQQTVAWNGPAGQSIVAGSGQVIAGRYTLRDVIGEGGMGSVYLASQTEPVKRDVALKVIKTGMDSRAVLARFDAERQALAMMDHPSIARIYDGGVTDQGQPYFAMELVKGVPLTEYCDTKRLSVASRLQLFVQVCQAVQHAHQKGIIHRDLKPGNILVTEVDGHPTPKVIDFGVAKAIEQKLTDMSFAETGAIVGTPAYMSPEQADPLSMDIDTRTDVYALGVILYELLTGSQPIDASQFQRGAIYEMLRMVREVDPPRPSTKVTAAEALPSIAANRGIEPASLGKLLSRELDWVVMKALEKDRNRRYSTALGLTQDIQRYLADEVVEARPPSRGYRLKKFVRRNKGQVLAASAILAALLLGTIGSTTQAVRATRAEAQQREATQNAEKLATANAQLAEEEADQRIQAERARAKAEAERERADRERIVAETAKYAMQLKLAEIDFTNYRVESAVRTLEATKPEIRGWEYQRLAAQCRTRMRSFADDTAYASVAITGNGRLVAAGNAKLVRIWDFDSRQLLAELEADGSPIEDVTFSRDGQSLAAVTKSFVGVWDVQTRKLVGNLAIDPPAILRPRITFDPQGKRIAVAHGGIQVWDATLSNELLSIKPDVAAPEKGYFAAIAFDPPGERLATRLMIDQPPGARAMWAPEEYLLLDARTGKQLATSGREQTGMGSADFGNTANAIGFAPSGEWFYTSGGARLKIRDPETAKVTRETSIPMCTSVAMCGDGTRLAVLKTAGVQADVYQLPDLESLHVMPFVTLPAFPQAIAISSDGRRVVATSAGRGDVGRVVGWVLGENATTLSVAASRSSPISGVTTSSEAGWVAVARVEVERINPEKVRQQRPIRPKQFGWLDFHSLTTGKLLFSLPKIEERITWLASSRDGQTVVTAGSEPDSPIRLWDVANRKISRELKADRAPETKSVIRFLTTSATAERVCATVAEYTMNESGRVNNPPVRARVFVWDANTGNVVWQTTDDQQVPSGLPLGQYGATLDPTGRRVAFIQVKFKNGVDGPRQGKVVDLFASTVSLYEVPEGKLLGKVEVAGTVSVTFPPTDPGIYLSGDGIVHWDYTTGEQTQVSDLSWQQLSISPGGDRLIAVENQLALPGIVRWIDANTRQEVYRVPNETMRFSHDGVQLTDDGKTLVVHDARKVELLRSE